jgi:GTP-binding protein
MDFLDETIITAISGDGGKGCISFRREKFIPKGGPDGGDGGDGGSIIVRASTRLHTLTDFKSHKYFKAPNGKPGRGKNQSGKNGPDLFIDVPLGTIIEDFDTGELLADLIHDKQKFVLLAGGRGGKGNQRFATSTNRAPRIAHPGFPGQEKRLKLSLKLLADIGLIGLPNAGKSTLLSRLSMARPKIDRYPFTTLTPNLGVMVFDSDMSLIIADIPGLIEGASAGRGLGHRFLKHIERTKLLLHVLDITYRPDQDILEDFHALRHEMAVYNPALIEKPQMVLINKMDLYNPGHRDLRTLQMALGKVGIESLPISALTGEGLGRLKKFIEKKWIKD